MNDMEKRREDRYDLNKTIHIVSINDDSKTALKTSRVDIQNISRSGIGFQSKTKLKIGCFYEFTITIWNTNVIHATVCIVRLATTTNGEYSYGGIFIDLSDFDELLIKSYEIFQRSEEK